ncbi:hypothetical protein Tco_0466465 [Tanacetum coccineum]
MTTVLWIQVTGYLEEIVVQRKDQKLYKFKEGDFPRLNLRDIEDMLLLLVQNKITNLEKDAIFDLNVALRMFTRHVVILKRVEDLQLGVESYRRTHITEARDIQIRHLQKNSIHCIQQSSRNYLCRQV